ncbi:unnamed protein product [Rotaria socialis]|uniref:Uncharacterized protein n=1 Tax=Rotaria socialis TaxID=392032 RepID=A0A818PNY2_9BILA|nr:unnamed protein product [Rotaria socialis]CAF3626416.1 unnamed protein product [Rotaria socialis]CAF4321668.1 unnamed protein product [Rotaria socialis]CAF4684080.1 unnamed protein product [Rotaria socialis]
MQQEDLKWRLDLMSRDMTRLRRDVATDHGENQHNYFSMLIPLQDQRWSFVNWFTNKLWIVDQQGRKTRLVKETKIKILEIFVYQLIILIWLLELKNHQHLIYINLINSFLFLHFV